MSCEQCPNRFRSYDALTIRKPGDASVGLFPAGGLACIFFTSDGARVGTAEYSREGLADRVPGLNEKIDACLSPLAIEEALALDRPDLDGACRPLAEVLNVNNGDEVAALFAPN